MVGTLPRYKLLLLDWDRYVGVFDSWLDLGLHLGVTADKKTGQIWVKTHVQPQSYVVDEWTTEEMIKDWCRNHLERYLSYSRYKLYKVL